MAKRHESAKARDARGPGELEQAPGEVSEASAARAEQLARTNRALAVEIEERRRAERELRRRADMAHVVAEASRRLVNASSEQLDVAIDSVLESIGRFAGADRAYLFQLREGGQIKDNTHEWCADGVAPEKDSLRGLRVDDFPLWMEPLMRLEPVHIPRVEDLPNLARIEKRHLEEQHIRSMVLVPMAWEDHLAGFLGFDSVRAVRDWRREDTALLETIGDVLVHAVQRERGQRALADSQRRVRNLEKMEAVGRLAGGVAHDFNNLLSVIETNAGFLQAELEEDHPLRGEVAEIRAASSRAAELTRQLLAFGRRQVHRPRPRDLNEVVRSVERMLRRLVGENISIQLRLATDLRPILADRSQLEQIIVNLALNARDAMPLGGALTIETRNRTDDWVMLSVSDTGEGMDEDTRQRMFEPFFTTKKLGQGTGLGLATVYGIVRQSAGEISAESAPGRGSTVKVSFPTTSKVPAPTPHPSQPGDPAAAGSPKHETVLLVEDEPAVLRAAARILTSQGYEVVEAASGEEALALAATLVEPPEVLLSDVIMPGLSGPETVAGLLNLWPDLRVLFMSGYPDDALEEHGVVDSDVVIVEKPFSAERLASAVREATMPGLTKKSDTRR